MQIHNTPVRRMKIKFLLLAFWLSFAKCSSFDSVSLDLGLANENECSSVSAVVDVVNSISEIFPSGSCDISMMWNSLESQIPSPMPQDQVNTVWNAFITNQPEEIKSSCLLNVNNHVVDAETSEIIKVSSFTRPSLSVPLDSGEIYGTTEFISNGLINQSNSNKVHSSAGGRGVKIFRSLTGEPKLLTLRLERFIAGEFTFNDILFHVDQEVMVNSVPYRLIAKIEYDQANNSYEAKISTGVLTGQQRIPDRKSVLLFYLKTEPLPESNSGLLQFSLEESSSFAAFITLLYSIPKLKSLIGTATSPLSTVLSSAINQLETSTHPVPISVELISSLKSLLSPGSEEMLLVDKLWNSFVFSQGEGPKDACVLNLITKATLVNSNFVFNQNAHQLSLLSVPIANGALFSIAEFVENGFLDPSNKIKTHKIKKNDGTEVSVKISRTLMNNPDILTFRIERFDASNNFKTDPILIDREIVVNGALYLLEAKIDYYPVEKVYMTNVKRSLPSNFEAEIQETLSEDIEVDTNSVLLFYSQKSLKRKNEIDEEEEEHLKRKKQLQQQIQQQREQQREEEAKIAQIYAPKYENYSSDYANIFRIAETEIRKRSKKWPVELLQVFSKYIYGTYILNSESYAFKEGETYPALEIVLGVLAVNKKACGKLFEIATKPQAPIVEIEMAVVVARMLIGCKNIPLKPLVDVISRHNGDPYTVTTYIRYNDVAALGREINNIKRCVSSKIFGFPIVNVVTYDDPESDSPDSVLKNQQINRVDLTKLIPPRQASMKGLWIDALENGCRVRNIFTIPNSQISDSSIFSLEIDRWKREPEDASLVPNAFDFAGDKYYAIGVVSTEANDRKFNCMLIDSFSESFRKVQIGGESGCVPMKPENYLEFAMKLKKQSVHVFFAEKLTNLPTPTNSRFIPKEIFSWIMRDLAQEIGFTVKDK